MKKSDVSCSSYFFLSPSTPNISLRLVHTCDSSISISAVQRISTRTSTIANNCKKKENVRSSYACTCVCVLAPMFVLMFACLHQCLCLCLCLRACADACACACVASFTCKGFVRSRSRNSLVKNTTVFVSFSKANFIICPRFQQCICEICLYG